MKSVIEDIARILIGYSNTAEFLEKMKTINWHEYKYEKGRKLILKLKDKNVYAGILKINDIHTVFYTDKNQKFTIKKDTPLKAFMSLERICYNSI